MSESERTQPLREIVERTMILGERVVAIRLEQAMWEAFDEICERERMSPDALCLQAERRIFRADLVDKISDAVTDYFEEAARRDRSSCARLSESDSEDGEPKLSAIGLSALDAIGPAVKKE